MTYPIMIYGLPGDGHALDCGLVIDVDAGGECRRCRTAPQAAWRSEISRALTGVTGRPEFKVVRTNKKQVLLVTFRVDPAGKMQAVQVKNIRDSTYQTRTAVKRAFSEIRFPSPPAGDQPNKFTVPIVIEPELTREEMIEQLESKSKALADLAEKLRRQK
ncbi:hypothetical protein ACSV5S_20125 [Agrobacterium deltaense]|uniref:hypothetical protein n=1 Tax=Agrobacterium deltaense TaxID=1183412 RepID=UPI003FD4FD39